jgi:radical SAM protein with 4Fe4S-binding SPASM domain
LHCGQLSSTEVLALLDSYANFLKIVHGDGIVYFTGGEPLMDPHLCKYLQKAVHYKMAPRILTNGTLLTADYAYRLKKVGTKVVQISFDGIEVNHDSLRGKGNFVKATQGLDYCYRADLSTTMMVTLTRTNKDDFEALILHGIKHNVHRIGVGRLVPTGQGKNLSNDFLSAKEIHETFQKYKSLQQKYSNQIEITIHDPLWTTFFDTPNIYGCSAGQHGMCVIHNGDVMPCRRMNYVIGNVRKQSFMELWHHPLMQQLRTRVHFEGKCHNCEKLKNCGGCRAVAYAVHNSVLAEDPQCFYCENAEIGMKEKIKEKIKRLILNGLMLKSGQNSRAPIGHKDLRDTHQSHGNLVDNMLQSLGD